jgi:hypothetical protein
MVLIRIKQKPLLGLGLGLGLGFDPYSIVQCSWLDHGA